MTKSRFVRWLFLATVVCADIIYSQSYPTKPIRIVTADIGGSSDFMSRLISSGVPSSLGQQIVVDNRGSALNGEVVAKAAPDGYTLLVNGTAFWIAPLLRSNPSYDAVRDFAPISMLSTSPNVLVVHPSLPVKSVRELIALAKAKPGALNYGSASVGAPSHLSAELFKSMAGVNIVRVPYKGQGQALTALISGEVQLIFTAATSGMAHIKAGRLRALAVTSAEPSALFPGVATVSASGVPSYEAATVLGLFAPAGTPAPIIARLNQEVVRFLNVTDVKEKFFSAGIETLGTSPEQLLAFVKADLARMGKVIKDAGIQAD